MDISDARAVACNEPALREAIAEGGKLQLDCAPGRVIDLERGHLPLDGDFVLDGGGAILDANGRSRIFSSNRQEPYEQTLQNLTLRNGRAVPVKYDRWPDPLEDGGAIFSENRHSLTVIDCRFETNESPGTGGEDGGGAIVKWGGVLNVVRSTFVKNVGTNGGAIKTLGTRILIHDSTFEANRNRAEANNGGGAIINDHTVLHPGLRICASRFVDNRAFKLGGAVYAYLDEGDGEFVIDQCEFAGNTVEENSGTHPGTANGGGIAVARGAISIHRSTFSENECTGHGGGLYAFESGELLLDSSTVHGNRARTGGGVLTGITTRIVHSTITYNVASWRSGGINGGDTTTLADSILAFNDTTDSANVQNNCGRAPVVEGTNLEWPLPTPVHDDNPRCVPSGAIESAPRFEPLGDHGGLTPTLPLQPGSPGEGAAATCSGSTQRGTPREAPCDVGAVGD